MRRTAAAAIVAVVLAAVGGGAYADAEPFLRDPGQLLECPESEGVWSGTLDYAADENGVVAGSTTPEPALPKALYPDGPAIPADAFDGVTRTDDVAVFAARWHRRRQFVVVVRRDTGGWYADVLAYCNRAFDTG